jgi:multidrug efflux pump subunit AcrA (membrane-fusion protein)
VSAVFKNADGTEYVLLAGSDEHAHQQTVKTGIRNSNSVQITDGIKEGDSVITSGGYGVPDKTAIKIETAATPEPAGADADDKGADKSSVGKAKE